MRAGTLPSAAECASSAALNECEPVQGGCTDCPVDTVSAAGATSCTDCPAGKHTNGGTGKIESECEDKQCGAYAFRAEEKKADDSGCDANVQLTAGQVCCRSE
jgi:hypothetical protein